MAPSRRHRRRLLWILQRAPENRPCGTLPPNPLRGIRPRGRSCPPAFAAALQILVTLGLAFRTIHPDLHVSEDIDPELLPKAFSGCETASACSHKCWLHRSILPDRTGRSEHLHLARRGWTRLSLWRERLSLVVSTALRTQRPEPRKQEAATIALRLEWSWLRP